MSDVVADPNYQQVLNKITQAEQQGLTILDLYANQLTTLPAEICRLINLTTLSLSYNRLTTLPVEICKLINLTELYLGGNRLTTLPIEICRLINLTIIDLSGNPIYNTLQQQGVDPDNTRQVLNYYRKIADKHNYLMSYSALALGCPWPVASALSVCWPTILPTS